MRRINMCNGTNDGRDDQEGRMGYTRRRPKARWYFTHDEKDGVMRLGEWCAAGILYLIGS